MLKLLISIITLTSITFGYSNIQLQGGTFQSAKFNDAAKFAIKYERLYHHGFGFEIGASAMQSSLGNQDMTQVTLPFAGIKQYFRPLKSPIKLYIGAGFNVNQVPSDFGKNYIGTYVSTGFIYPLTKRATFLSLDITFNDGKTKKTGTHSFNGTTYSLGFGFNIGHMKHKAQHHKKKQLKAPKDQWKTHNPRKPRQLKRKKGIPSSYKKSQKIMDELSWPTY